MQVLASEPLLLPGTFFIPSDVRVAVFPLLHYFPCSAVIKSAIRTGTNLHEGSYSIWALETVLNSLAMALAISTLTLSPCLKTLPIFIAYHHQSWKCPHPPAPTSGGEGWPRDLWWPIRRSGWVLPLDWMTQLYLPSPHLSLHLWAHVLYFPNWI